MLCRAQCYRSNVIDHLRDTFTEDDVGVAFFYFDYRDQDFQSRANIIASILKQLASSGPELPGPIAEFYKRFQYVGGQPKAEDLQTVLLLTCKEFRQVFIVLDALDECDAKRHRRSFLGFLKALMNTSVQVLVTSRPHPYDIKQTLDACPTIKIEASDSDISTYLSHEIAERGDMDLIDEHLEEEIVTTLVKGAQGMHVSLF